MDLLILTYVFCTPITAFVFDLGVMQFPTIINCGFYVFPWLCISAMINILRDPYSSKDDAFHVDGLVCWSERVIFANLRVQFSLDGIPTEAESNEEPKSARRCSVPAVPAVAASKSGGKAGTQSDHQGFRLPFLSVGFRR
eukprot:3329384-Prymnesium_polylepis.1